MSSTELKTPPESPVVYRPSRTRGAEYEPFGNVGARNDLQSRLEIPAMLRLLRPPFGVRILEIGCGRGVALPVITRLLEPLSLTGLDVDPALLAIARESAREAGIPVRLVEDDVRSMSLESESVDLAIDFGTCYHVSGGSAGSRMALQEVSRVLRPGGFFIHETPVAQMLAHPVRSFGRRLPWDCVPELAPYRRALLWCMRRKQARRE